MYESQEIRALGKYFTKLALAAEGANFLAVWGYMKGYLDIEKSSAYGRWYMQRMLSYPV